MMPLFPAKSTAFSDAVLAASCFWAFSMLEGLPWGLWKTDLPDTNNSKTLAKIWFTLVLTASVVGIFRFGRREFFNQLGPLHETLSWLGAVVGLPCLVAQFYINGGLDVQGNLHLLLLLPPVFSWLGSNTLETNRISSYVATFCTVSLTCLAIYSRNYVLLTATILMGISGIVNDFQEPKFGLPPVDWFHYGMSLSNYLLVAALTGDDVPGTKMLRDKLNYIFV